MSDYGVYLSLGTFAAIIFGTGGAVWKLARSEKETREWTEALVDNLRRDLNEVDRMCVSRGDDIRKEAGELGHALRTKIHEVETWNRDTFVRTDSFEIVINQIRTSLEKNFDKLETKIDKIDERLRSGPQV